MDDSTRAVISGRAVSVRGNDIDTDRIIPARFLTSVVFDGLGQHAFADDRAQVRERGEVHPFDAPAFAEARLLLVNKNFGCGSSREHAPQALVRWGKGIRAIIGESFAEIFFGNCVAIGVPCVTVGEAAIQELMAASEARPDQELRLDLERLTVAFGDLRLPVDLPAGPREQFLTGRWDSTAELLEATDLIAATAARLPYFDNWA